MCKKTEPQVTTQKMDSQVVMPEYVQDAQKNLLRTGQSILEPYLHPSTPGYGVSGFSQDQTTAMGGVRDLYGSAMNGSGALDPADITKFLNPYTQNVVDTTNQTLRDQNDVTLNGIRARAAAGSSFGGSGSRAALQETTANNDLSKTIASTTAQLMAQGYDKATATALASKQSDISTRAAATQALMESGNQQQQLYQTQMDMPLKALQSLLAITPQQYGSSTSGTTVTTAPPPQSASPLQQVLGGGLSILGMGMGGPLGGATLGGSLFSKLLGK